MKIKAYAKINLTLDIIGKREDGYHLLDSVMQSISLWDEIEIRREGEPGIRLLCDRHYLPSDEKNTAYRAAVLFLAHCGLKGEGLSLSIEKRIPSRAGLGGGSADAAAVLHGLNRLYEAHLDLATLMELGKKVGADVPFCLQGGTARCTGIGEQVRPAAPLQDCFLLICKPPAGMSTPRAYALLDRYPTTSRRYSPAMLSALESGRLPQTAKLLGNRFDETMKLMQVRTIKRLMVSSGALGALMTGSGSAVFGIFDTEGKARTAAENLEGKGEIYLTRPVTAQEVQAPWIE